MSEKIILGIDPGTTIMGFGIIKANDRKMSLIEMNELNLKKHKDHYLKLKLVFERTIALIEDFNPDEIVMKPKHECHKNADLNLDNISDQINSDQYISHSIFYKF